MDRTKILDNQKELGSRTQGKFVAEEKKGTCKTNWKRCNLLMFVIVDGFTDREVLS